MLTLATFSLGYMGVIFLNAAKLAIKHTSLRKNYPIPLWIF